MCDSVTQEARKILAEIYNYRFRHNLTLTEEKELKELTKYVEENIPIFSAGGYFNITKSTLLDMTLTVANFLIVALQVQN